MFCPKCGTQLPDSALFCSSCGSATKNLEQDNQQAPVYETPSAYQSESRQPGVTTHYTPPQPIQQYAPAEGSVALQANPVPSFNLSSQNYAIQTGLLPWFKETISVSPTMLKGSYPSSFAGIIPFGINQISVPIEHISNVHMHTKLHFGQLVAGILGILIGIWLMTLGDIWLFVGLIPLLWGANSCLNSYTCVIQYEKSGIPNYIFAIFFEKSKLLNIADALNHQIEMNNSKVVSYQQTATLAGGQQASTNAIVGAIRAI